MSKAARHFYHVIKKELRNYNSFKVQSSNSFGSSVFYNWWEEQSIPWFAQRYQSLLEENNRVINFCSLFGEREVLEHISGLKVFFSGENVHNQPFSKYSDYLLNEPSTNLGLGFDYFENERYLRFPLWLIFMFKPTSTREDVILRCKELRYPDISRKTRFCSMVSSHDPNGYRKGIVDSLNSISHVSCAGKYLHNDDALKDEFKDNKIEYLKEFYFNICPENSNSSGYVTEKLFQAVASGCIPVYSGSYNSPEPHIFNHDAILFWDLKSDNQDLIRRIDRLYSSPKDMEEFLQMPRLKDDAEDVIWEMLNSLDTKIIELLKK